MATSVFIPKYVNLDCIVYQCKQQTDELISSKQLYFHLEIFLTGLFVSIYCNMILLYGVALRKYSFLESQSEDTSHGNQLGYFVTVTFSNIFLSSTKLLFEW